MSRWAPCKRREFIRKLRKMGFEGPYSGTRHQFMVYGQHRMAIPTSDEYSVPQVRMMIREVEGIIAGEITAERWNGL